MLLDFFGKHIAQPHRGVLENVTGLTITQSTSPDFLSQGKEEEAMSTAQRRDLINIHIGSVRPN